MQPKMCCKCKKNVAVIFITKVENGVTLNEGYCLKCARSSGNSADRSGREADGHFRRGPGYDLSDEMSSMFGQKDDSEGESDEVDSQTATFPLLNQLFGGCTKPAQPAGECRGQGEGSRKGEEKVQASISSWITIAWI